MAALNTGQPVGGIMQLGYVVEDIHASMREWITKLHVGPWFLLEHWTGDHPVYRGRESRADVAIAMSFSGHMNVELIQPNDTHPSVYKEHIDGRGYGFHHWGIASADLEADVKKYAGLGMEVAYRVGVPTGGDVVYMDPRGTLCGFLELIGVSAQMEQFFSRLYSSTLGWDGTEPVRPFM